MSPPAHSPTIVGSVFVGRPESKVDDRGRAWRSAIGKTEIGGTVKLGPTNLDGDEQADLRVHGGPDKALCAYVAHRYAEWLALDDWPSRLGADVFGPGAFGENLSLVGSLDETSVCIGDRFRIGTALVEVSQPRSPCWKLARRWNLPDLPSLTQASGRTGWYFRVIEAGTIEAGSPLELIDQPFERWTIAEVNDVMYNRRGEVEPNRELAGCLALSSGWREKALRRSTSGGPAEPSDRQRLTNDQDR